MSQEADPPVFVNPWDLKELGKKHGECLQVDPDLFKPVPAISKAGFSTATMFGRHNAGNRPARKLHGEITVQSLRPNYHGTRDLSIKDYARLFDKYYDAAQGSRIDRMVARSKMTQDPLLDASIDSEIERRASREPRAKYLSAALADKYDVPAAAIKGAPPRPPQILGLAMVPGGSSGGHLPPELLASQQDTHSSARVMELAQTLAESDKYRNQQAEIQAKSEADARRAYVTRAAAPMPASQVFRTTTRDQAELSANRAGQRGADAPGPGRYNVQWHYWDKPPPTTMIGKPCYKDEPTPQKQRRAEWEAQRQRQIQETEKAGGKWRPASAAAQHSTAGMGGASVDKQPRPHTAAIMQRQGSGLQRQASFGLQRQASLGLQRQASGGMQRQASGGLSRWNSGKSAFSRSNSKRETYASGDVALDTQGRLAVTGGHQARPRSAINKSEAGIALFKDAHHVHGSVPREDPTAGTSSFKAVPRPSLVNTGGSSGSHLALKYFHEGIDDVQRRSAHLVLPFSRQTERPTLLGATGSTTSALGPGTYIKGEQPTSLMGRHVEAGHKGIKHTPSFAKMTSRPGSAPPASAPPHPLQGGPVPPVPEAEVQGALLNMFGEQLNPSELISVQEVQAHTQPDHTRFTSPPSSPQHQQQSPRAVSSLGPEHLARYSSSGLAKPIPGGSFSRTTRAQEVQAMRAAADGKIIPPASAPLQKIRPMQAADVIYETPDPTVQGSHPRAPAWKLPPNRVAASRQWISAAALAYI
uniref:Uncharacterized protein n=2 Tax=Dunaliella tertiolecta TaxID=3047 RepID=A0A7S3QXA0_DUNTE|mmetsp:Transcript_14563/g.39434  ORF Transcript_14563/g.39434 Transcript_14563/m.39434 type:complete len:757 (-) Transcript_14563:148-2418(-)